MCHDASTAERFYVALPNKVTGYETRRLRLKALKMAAAEPSDEDETNTDSPLDEVDDTAESSSEDEEPIYDDQVSVSSLSSEELKIMREKRKRPSLSREYFPSTSQESLPSAQPPTSKKKLHFSPSQCVCAIERLPKSLADYYVQKAGTKK